MFYAEDYNTVIHLRSAMGFPKAKFPAFYTCIAGRRNVTVKHVVNALGRTPLLEVLRKDLIENKCDKNHYAFWGFRAAAIPFGI
jgi:hypothetical protein